MICPFLDKHCLQNNNFQQPQQLGCPFIMKRRKSSDFSTYMILLIWSILLGLMFLFFVFIYNKGGDDEEVDDRQVFILRLPPSIKHAVREPDDTIEEAATESIEAEEEEEATETEEEAEADEEGVEVIENDRRSLLSKLAESRTILQ